MNFDSQETVTMPAAIEKGLVKTRPLPNPVAETMSFSISSVTDPNTGTNQFIPSH